jgi:nucleoside-diphosphate-sugar epimerase
MPSSKGTHLRALVVGGTGPTGPLVVEGLSRRGYRVTILHTGKHEIEFGVPVEHLHGDLHFLLPLREILHGRSFDLVVGMYGRLRYLAEAIKGKTPRFIAVGGMPYRAFVEGEKGDEGVPVPVPEEAPLFREEERNKFTYLMTVSEEAVMEAHKNGFYTATILRFPMIYGPRQVAPREWCIVRRILDGRKHLVIPDGGLRLERRGYIENVAHAVMLAVDKAGESAGQIYNVGDETVWSLRNWINLITRTMNHRWKLVSMPFTIARPSRSYAGRDFHWVPDIDKIKGELGYRDQVPPDEGLRRTIAWYIEQRPQPGGAIEKALMDAFDYPSEDRLIAEYERGIEEIKQHFPSVFRFHHAYDHPRDTGQATMVDHDESGGGIEGREPPLRTKTT